MYRNPVWNVLCVAAIVLAAAGCSRKSPTEPWPPITDPLVFDDAFGANVGFQAFLGSKLDAVTIDATTRHSGTTCIRIVVPPPGAYSGGAFVTSRARSLTGYNALSFWVKASQPTSLDAAGIGNNNAGTSKYEARRVGIAVDTSWKQVIVPIPLPSRLDIEQGMFFFADSSVAPAGITLWIDDMSFVNDPTVTNPRPAMNGAPVSTFAGVTLPITATTRTTFSINGTDAIVLHMPGYFDFTSSVPAVATVGAGTITAVGSGSTNITAVLGSLPVTGSLTVNVTAPPPTTAPAPTVPAADVISMFSNSYPNVTVDTWSATWDAADVADLSVGGNSIKAYTNLSYAGVEFPSHLINATAMTHFHVDVYAPSGTTFKVKLVDFGANGVYHGTVNDDTESELTFNAASTPALVTGQWVGLEIPMSSFTALAERAHLAQLVLSGDTRTVFVDNIYFHK